MPHAPLHTWRELFGFTVQQRSRRAWALSPVDSGGLLDAGWDPWAGLRTAMLMMTIGYWDPLLGSILPCLGEGDEEDMERQQHGLHVKPHLHDHSDDSHGAPPGVSLWPCHGGDDKGQASCLTWAGRTLILTPLQHAASGLQPHKVVEKGLVALWDSGAGLQRRGGSLLGWWTRPHHHDPAAQPSPWPSRVCWIFVLLRCYYVERCWKIFIPCGQPWHSAHSLARNCWCCFKQVLWTWSTVHRGTRGHCHT